MLTFLRIESRGGNRVAVLCYDDGTFCLNEQSLRTRIANVEAGLANPDRDTSVEKFALAQLLATSIKET